MAKWSECKSYMRRFMKIEKKQICTKRLIAYHQGSLPVSTHAKFELNNYNNLNPINNF